MKTIDEDTKRQIIQLWIVARHYLLLAKWAHAQDCRFTHGDIKDRFSEGRMPSADDLQLLYLGAALNSAAVRLATIDEILYSLEPKGSRCSTGYRDLLRYFNPKDMSIRVDLNDGFDRWLHVLMRHNVAHEEPRDEDAGSEVHWRRQQRQQALEQLAVSQAYH